MYIAAMELPGVLGEPGAGPDSQFPFYEFLGVRAQALAISDLNAIVGRSIASGERIVVANHNLHSVYLHHTDVRMRAFYDRADVVHVDGMVLIAIARMLRLPLRRPHRVTYVDWVWPLLDHAADRQWRVYYLGSREEALAAALDRINGRYPHLKISGRHGYFDATKGGVESISVVRAINEFRPDVLMVGMGMPRQEHWILDHWDELSPPVILQAGGCMDYVAGVVRTPPRWVGRLGLEWMYRLTGEPTRLWRRYIVEPVLLAKVFMRRRRGRS